MVIYDDPNTGQRLVANLETVGDTQDFEEPKNLRPPPLRYYVVELTGERTFIGHNIMIDVGPDSTIIRQA